MLILTASLFGAAPGPLRIGDTAPPFSLPGSPEAVDLASLRGEPVAVNFWASWCAPCRTELPVLEALSRAGVRVVTVNVDRELAPPQDLIRRLSVDLPVGWDRDGVVSRAWSPDALPITYLLDSKGVVRLIQRGAIVDPRAFGEAATALGSG